MALQWIQDNVQYFGGDSSKVNIDISRVGQDKLTLSPPHHLTSIDTINS